MSGLARMNAMMDSGLLPFNYGMEWMDWQCMWEQAPNLRHLIGETEPCLWSDEAKQRVDAQAQVEVALAEELMTLDDESFRLRIEQARNDRKKEVEDNPC